MNKDRSRESDICDNFVLNAYQDYSVDTVADLLLPTGFLIDRTTQYAGSLEKFVFLKGNTSEVYTTPEMEFIDGVVDFCVFKEFSKKTNRSTIPCHIFAAKIDGDDVISAGIAFTKIMNKALDGMNICILISKEGFLFTGRLFEQRNSNGCFVSDLIRTEGHYVELVSELMFAPEYEEFIEYYSYIKSVLHYPENILPYTDRLLTTRRISYSYIEELQDLAKIFNISYAREIGRCFYENEEPLELSYSDKVQECEEYLFKIDSSRVNTMEILFEAEEMERLASETEESNDKMLQQSIMDEGEENAIDEETKALLDDPEGMIKMLKKKRGI